jgi:hypothetical protein
VTQLHAPWEANSFQDDPGRSVPAALRTCHLNFGVPQSEYAHLYTLASLTDLIDAGVSDDEDMRVFEIGWKATSVSAWAEHPLFLTDDTSLLGKWAEWFADSAQTRALEAINRARL